MRMAAHKRKLAVVGLGYVGLPVAAAFARTGAPVIGFDVDADRIAQLRNGIDPTGELSEADLASANLRFSSKAADLAVADFYIIAVPTPIDVARRPDLSALLQASEMVGRTLARRHCRVRIVPSTPAPPKATAFQRWSGPPVFALAAISPSAVPPSASMSATMSIVSRRSRK